jgi:hypothetical protein
LQCAAQLLHGQRAPQQLVLQHIPALQLLAQAAHLQHQATALQRTAHGFHKAFGRKRLFQKIGSAILHGLHGHGDIAMPGDENHGQLGVQHAHGGQQPKAAHLRQADVADHDAGKIRGQVLLRLLGTAHADAVQTFEAHGLLAGHGDIGIVFNDQDFEEGFMGCRQSGQRPSIHQGQAQREDGPAFRMVAARQAAACGLGDLGRQRQAQAQAQPLGLGREKGSNSRACA